MKGKKPMDPYEEADLVVVGSGIRGSKIVVDGAVLARLPGAEVIDGLATAGSKLPATKSAVPIDTGGQH